jgi:16S rRNA (uracil1498-N3)-methyltransferase
MARRRFFVHEIHHGRAELTGEDAYHLSRVLRVDAGQRFEISDNRRVYLSEVVTARKDHIVFSVIEELPVAAPPVSLTLLISLIKFDRLEWILEKATELGVERIVPVIAALSGKGLDKAAAKRLARWRKILLESSQQARRARLPDLDGPVSFEQATSASAGYRYFLEEEAGTPPIQLALPEAARR